MRMMREGDMYYYVDTVFGEVDSIIAGKFERLESGLSETGNVFKTRDEAEEALEKIKKIFKGKL